MPVPHMRWGTQWGWNEIVNLKVQQACQATLVDGVNIRGCLCVAFFCGWSPNNKDNKVTEIKWCRG